MSQQQEKRVRDSASYRREAREALKGKWKAALLVGLLLALLGGQIFGASVQYETDEDAYGYMRLDAVLGPFCSVSWWDDGEMAMDAADYTVQYDPMLIRYSPAFVVAAGVTAFIILALMPLQTVARQRMNLRILAGEKPDAGVLRIGWRLYWKAVRTLLLGLVMAFWPVSAAAVVGVLLALVLPEGARSLVLLLILAAAIVSLVRALGYAANGYLLATEPEMSAREILKKSRMAMKGRKGRLFCLGLSFFGWALLLAAVVAATEFMEQSPVMILIGLVRSLLVIPLTVYSGAANTAFFRYVVSGGRWQEMEGPTEHYHKMPDPSANDPWADPAQQALIDTYEPDGQDEEHK